MRLPSSSLPAPPAPTPPRSSSAAVVQEPGPRRRPRRRSQHPRPRASRDGARPPPAQPLSAPGRGSRRVGPPHASRLRCSASARGPHCAGEVRGGRPAEAAGGLTASASPGSPRPGPPEQGEGLGRPKAAGGDLGAREAAGLGAPLGPGGG